MANTTKTTTKTAFASGHCPLKNHETSRTRYNSWSQQWWNNNFRESEHDDFIVAAVLAGFRREVKLNYGPESVGHIPLFPGEIRALPVNSIGKREHTVEDNFDIKPATFGNIHVSDDDGSDEPRRAKRARRVGRDKPNSTKQKVQTETLLRRAELDSGDSDSAVPDARPEPAAPANPFCKGRKLVADQRPNIKTYKRRNSRVSYADNSDEGDNKAEEDDAAHSADEHHASVNDFPQRARSGSADSQISLDSNATLEVERSPAR